jgi:hypothetical protein
MHTIVLVYVDRMCLMVLSYLDIAVFSSCRNINLEQSYCLNTRNLKGHLLQAVVLKCEVSNPTLIISHFFFFTGNSFS